MCLSQCDVQRPRATKAYDRAHASDREAAGCHKQEIEAYTCIRRRSMARLIKEDAESDEVEAKATVVRHQQQVEEMEAVCQSSRAAPVDAAPYMDDNKKIARGQPSQNRPSSRAFHSQLCYSFHTSQPPPQQYRRNLPFVSPTRHQTGWHHRRRPRGLKSSRALAMRRSISETLFIF